MVDLILETVDKKDDVEALNEAILNGFDAVPLPPDVEPYRSIPLAMALRTPAGETKGGLIGQSAWGWLYVKYLWVAEAFRGHGYGKKLLDAAEAAARERGCHGIWLNTQSFQATAFYERQGYEQFGALPNMPESHRRVFYRKALMSDDS
ncbi:MAG: GNAT family N-acetyltransferase [Geminicoccaceae bacterium]